MKITVVGAGYVGLSLATLLSTKNDVIIYEINEARVNMINSKKSPIRDDFIEDYLSSKKLSLLATSNKDVAYNNTDLVIIATPTNYDSVTNSFDTSSVDETINDVSLRNIGVPVVIKSTIPIGYTKSIQHRYDNFIIIFSPEFLREGKALFDNLYPSRIIAGVDKNNVESINAGKTFLSLLKSCALKKDVQTCIIGSSEAEAVKLFSNTYLALRISYFNELDTFAKAKELDSKDIIDGVCADPRIGNHYNNPSFGYGGYCLPKDTKQLLSNYGNIPQNLISAVVESNSTRKQFVVDDIDRMCKRICSSINTKQFVIGVYKLTMKSDSDNFREAAIFDVVKGLKKLGYSIILFEPELHANQYMQIGFDRIENDFQLFKETADVIIANRDNKDLFDVKNKIYTRDIFYRD